MREIFGPRLEFGEQPDIFNRDDRLVRERLEQRDLLVGERSRFEPAGGDGADRATAAHQRHGQDTAEASRHGNGASLIITVLENVRDDNDTTGQDCTCGAAVASRWPGIVAAYDRSHFRTGSSDGRNMDELAVEGEDAGRIGVAEVEHRSRDRVEHRLHIGR